MYGRIADLKWPIVLSDYGDLLETDPLGTRTLNAYLRVYLVGVQSNTVAAVAGRLVAYVSFGGGEYDAGEAALDRGSPKVAALAW